VIVSHKASKGTDFMPLPNFLIIGAAKSGTSSVYSYLSQHPEVYTSPIKGPCFFAFEQGEKVQVHGPGDQEVFDRHIVTDVDKYHNLFDGAKGEKALGEASVLYLYAPTAAQRIRKTIPEVKLIAILRNPIDRAFSSYSHLRRDGREKLADFSEALRAEDSRVRGKWQHLWHYKQLGFYYAQLTRYYDIFPADQITVFTYDEFRANSLRVMKEIFAFLGVDDRFVPDASIWHNVSGTPKVRPLHNFLYKPNSMKALIKPLFPPTVRKRLRARAIKWNTTTAKAKLSDEVRAYLSDLYHEDIANLQRLLRKDLSHWLTPPTVRSDGERPVSSAEHTRA
jgi:hypothetical protein